MTWSVDGNAAGNSTVGTVTTAGLYNAPAQSGTHTVTAASVADTTKTASATVTIAGNVVITPSSAMLQPGATQQFSATETDQTNASVAWSVDGVSGGNSTAGTISSSGLYTAPSDAGNHTITAADAVNTADNATAPVSVSR